MKSTEGQEDAVDPAPAQETQPEGEAEEEQNDDDENDDEPEARPTGDDLRRNSAQVPAYVKNPRMFIEFDRMTWDTNMTRGQTRILEQERKDKSLTAAKVNPKRHTLEDILVVDNNGM